MNEYLEELEIKYQEDEIEQTIKSPSPFAIETGFYRLLPKEFVDFIGRDNFKSIIRKAIEKDPRIWIINLFGPGGVGKSALATSALFFLFETKRKTLEATINMSNLIMRFSKLIRQNPV